MNINRILSVLHGVKKTGDDKWIARCPAHEDKTPSLGIAVKNGKVLFKCWSHCSNSEVTQTIVSLGCDWDDLFPDSREQQRSFFPKPENKPTESDYILGTSRAMRASGGKLTAAEKEVELKAFLRRRMP